MRERDRQATDIRMVPARLTSITALEIFGLKFGAVSHDHPGGVHQNVEAAKAADKSFDRVVVRYIKDRRRDISGFFFFAKDGDFIA